jgi:hypothetical protein
MYHLSVKSIDFLLKRYRFSIKTHQFLFKVSGERRDVVRAAGGGPEAKFPPMTSIDVGRIANQN